MQAIGGPTEGFLRLRARVYASGCGKERHGGNGGANGAPTGAVNDFHDILCAKEAVSNVSCTKNHFPFLYRESRRDCKRVEESGATKC